ncbi:MAG: hypothetical protein LAT64_04815 [Phycisphaerales bacterium]|nr:hypothetical protein [Planctomycetota bacterium]MCH8508076.1 hypothetical protein [Phycisphaerales bacterium]
MNEDNTNPPAAREGPGRDLLIARIVDGAAGPEDWRAFRRAAEGDPAIWKDLGDAQLQHELLCESVREAAATADAVDLPLVVPDDAPMQRRLDGLARWGGWAVAAALLLIWSTGTPLLNQNQGAVQQAGLLPMGPALSEATPDEAMERYLNAGRVAGLVIGEVPDRPIVETAPLADGTIEVFYIRQIIERRVTDRIYRESIDEHGRAVAVPVHMSQIHSAHTN